MATAKGVKGTALLPVLIFGYLETLRRATFHGFGWSGSGQALTIIVVIVLLYQFTDYFQPSGVRRKATGTAAIIYAILVWYINRSNEPGEISKAGELFFGLPNFGLGSISLEYYGAFCFFVVSFYALLVFLITGYIIEKNNLAEMFFFGILLLGVLIIVSGESITGYVILNVFFSIGLRSQVYLLEMESDFRVRRARGSGLNIRSWSWISLAFIIPVVLAASMLPTGRPRIDLVSAGNKLAMEVTGKSAAVKQAAAGSYDVFWGRLQKFDLKGEVVTETRPVMYVKSEQPFYWRGDSADFYTGKGWRNTLLPRSLNGGEISSPYSRNVSVDKVEQVFVLAPGVTSQVIFSPGLAAQVELQEEDIRIDTGGNIYTSGLNPGGTYRVISYIPKRDEAQLKRSIDEYPLDIKQLYLQLPSGVPERVGTLAEKLTAHVRNPYDKAVIIEDYLSSKYAYDLSVRPASGSRDVTDYFLFDLQKGYCTYHSTAMVVMLRSIGIPARWVKGFTTGVYNPETEVYEVTMGDAHSWVEVYFADYGWIPFEPTPSFALTGVGGAPNAVLAGAETSGQETEFQGLSPEEILNTGDEGFPWGMALALVIVIAGAAVVYLLWRTKNIFKIGTGDQIRDMYISLVEMLKRKGYPRTSSQTPLEYVRGLSDQLPDDYCSIFTVTNAYLTDKYGKGKLSREELEEVRSVWRALVNKWTEKPGD
ncbi:transglutaminase TgpA family protein [Phosphitispora fastidiosa]|uniref:transglutaminase TgpA family protein n=1 Tax=Phosphitispora fastidiosa TaxID=2837202 RepID=UPI001E375A0F|nr:transglutaminase domain-containing protein [Phosphitispora fastidiosa]MBU7008506.1 transglutaminase-like putative cysteine protease [Phosphitispora fastidiosa]